MVLANSSSGSTVPVPQPPIPQSPIANPQSPNPLGVPDDVDTDEQNVLF